MKNKILIISSFFLFFNLFIYSIDIVECYNAIPEKLLGGNKFKLAYKNDKWISISSDGQEKEAIVDKDNYYLRIENEFETLYEVELEVTIYLTKTNYSIVAISMRKYGPAYRALFSLFGIYKYDGSNWIDVKSKIFPNINILSFYDKEFAKFLSKTSIDYSSWFGAIYILPRYGTKISARLKNLCFGEETMNFTPEEGDLYSQLSGNIKYKSIEIEYDSKNMKFFISNKILIIECYKAIPDKFFNNLKYKLSYKDNKWLTTSLANYEIAASVDMENYYICINDTSTGGGTVTHEIKIYLTDRYYSIVAINLKSSSFMESKSSLNLFMYDGVNWTNVTDKIFPIIKPDYFYDKDYLKKMYKKIKLDELFNVIYYLPEKEEMIIAKLGTTITFNSIFLSGKDQEKKDQFKQIVKDIKFKEIQIDYDGLSFGIYKNEYRNIE